MTLHIQNSCIAKSHVSLINYEPAGCTLAVFWVQPDSCGCGFEGGGGHDDGTDPPLNSDQSWPHSDSIMARVVRIYFG